MRHVQKTPLIQKTLLHLTLRSGKFYLSFEASVAQLVERHLAKVVVEGSIPFARSILLWGCSSVGRASDS